MNFVDRESTSLTFRDILQGPGNARDTKRFKTQAESIEDSKLQKGTPHKCVQYNGKDVAVIRVLYNWNPGKGAINPPRGGSRKDREKYVTLQVKPPRVCRGFSRRQAEKSILGRKNHKQTHDTRHPW